jgi:hypothetical protein
LVRAWAVVGALSTSMPVIAAVAGQPLPRWVGLLDVALAALLALLSIALTRGAPPAFDDRTMRRAFKVSRGASHVMIAMVALFLLVGDAIDWHVLLVGLGWRAWLFVWTLPYAISAWSRRPEGRGR